MTGDFNNDGHTDILKTDAIMLGDGTGGFTSLSYSGFAADLAMDINGDGKLDLLDKDQIRLGIGDGTFSEPVTLERLGDDKPADLLSTDLNNDGLMDRALVSSYHRTLELQYQNVYPGILRQQFEFLPFASVALTSGSNIFSVSQQFQRVEETIVTLIVDFLSLPGAGIGGSVQSPDGISEVAFGTPTDYFSVTIEGETRWRTVMKLDWPMLVDDPGNPSALAEMQPAGDWTVTIDNPTGLTGEVLSLRMVTRGNIILPQQGDAADWAEEILWPVGATGRFLKGTTTGYDNKETLSCDTETDNISPDHYYNFTLPERMLLDFQLAAPFDTVLELRTETCDAASYEVLACDNDSLNNVTPMLKTLALEPGDYCLVVDGASRDLGVPDDTDDDPIFNGDYFLMITTPFRDIEPDDAWVYLGSPTDSIGYEDDEYPTAVRLSIDYALSRTEVTQGLFESMMGYNPSADVNCGLDCPVQNVSWHEAAAFCNTLSDWLGLESCFTCSGSEAGTSCELDSGFSRPQDCNGIRLPTETEWEYASGGDGFHNGPITQASGTDPNLDLVGWYSANSESALQPVGKLAPSPLGLFDMHGNVYEWIYDDYVSPYPYTGTPWDPFGLALGTDRVLRGGAHISAPRYCRGANRNYGSPSYRSANYGFRMARTLP